MPERPLYEFSEDRGTHSYEPMIPLHEMWHNGGKRLLVILIIISSLVLLVVGGVAMGIIALDTRIKKLDERVGIVDGETSLAANQRAIKDRVDRNTDSLNAYEIAVNESWKRFQEHNPTVPVPQISETDSSKKADIRVIPARATPSPRPTVLPREKTRTIIKYKKAPTPKPWWKR